jgi:phosphoglycerate kinase
MLSNKLFLDDICDQIENKRVLLRADFNVPIEKGQVKDDKRMVETLHTIIRILDQNPKCLVIMSHLGRPEGRRVEKYSLKPVAERLQHVLGMPVTFLNDCVGEGVRNAINSCKQGEIFLLENVRFHLEEEGKGVDAEGNAVKASKDDIAHFRAELTSLGDIYINDAFGTAHRAHSSLVGINLPLRASGILMKTELDYFSKALENPKRPFLVILGGAKVKDKILLINNLLDKVDEMIIGGGMAFTFLKVLYGWEIGNSLFDETATDIVHEVVQRAKERGVKLHFPVDFVCGNKIAEDAEVIVTEGMVPKGFWGLDVGPKTCEIYKEVIQRCQTIIWNGPQGLFEMKKFRNGSESVVNELTKATFNGAITIVGGGDSVSMVNLMGEGKAKLSHLSTGGGASLELLEGKQMPGVEFLSNRTTTTSITEPTSA